MMGFFCKKTYCCNIYSDIDLKLNEHIICMCVFLLCLIIVSYRSDFKEGLIFWSSLLAKKKKQAPGLTRGKLKDFMANSQSIQA